MGSKANKAPPVIYTEVAGASREYAKAVRSDQEAYQQEEKILLDLDRRFAARVFERQRLAGQPIHAQQLARLHDETPEKQEIEQIRVRFRQACMTPLAGNW